MIPKGKILIIGGAEDKGDGSSQMENLNSQFEHFEILKELSSVSKTARRLEIITTASRVTDEIKQVYSRSFKKLGFHNIGYLNIENKIDANRESVIRRIKSSHTILFCGGEQFRIAAILGGTKAANAIKEKYINDKNFTIAGTSAGAMVLSKVMIKDGGVSEALVDTDIKTTSGLGFLEYSIVDTHFIKRGRFGRLAHSVIINPAQLGIGLGEDTALIIKKGDEAECRGSGMVVIIDGSNIKQTNITDVSSDDPVFVENLIVHILVKGCRFSLKTRKLHNPAIAKNMLAKLKAG